MNNTLKKILCFFGVFCAFVGFVGSLGYLIMLKQYPMAFFLCILFVAALPEFSRWLKILLS